MRAQTTRDLAVICGFFVTVADIRTLAQTPDAPSAARFAEVLFREAPGRTLAELRPAPVSAAVRERTLALLPVEGRLTPTAAEAEKLAATERILDYHQRLGVHAVVLIDVPQAYVGLVDRAAILVSRSALRSLTAAELQALVAHEVGHEFFWAEHQRAEAAGDARRLRDLELRCDVIAVLSLLELGLEPSALISAARKLLSTNTVLGATANGTRYPDLSERARVVERLSAQYDAASR